MARTWRDSSDDDDDSDDWNESDDYDPEDPETYPNGLYEDDELPTVPCIYCGAEILEDAEQCPRCSRYISREDRPPEPKSRAWIIMMILAFLTVLFWVFAG